MTASNPGRCPRCHQRADVCLCAELPRLRTRVGVVMLRHWRERSLGSNSARIAALALPEARLLDHGGPPPHPPLPALPELTGGEVAWLLFPVAPGEAATPPGPPPQRLIVVDGTWRQARRMVGRVPGLAALPRLSPPPLRPERARLRAQHAPGGMATLEALAAGLHALGEREVARALDEVYDRFVARVLHLKGHPEAPGEGRP